MIEGADPIEGENLKDHKGRKELRCTARGHPSCLYTKGRARRWGRFLVDLELLAIGQICYDNSFRSGYRPSEVLYPPSRVCAYTDPLASPRVIYNHALVRPALYRH